MKPNNNKFSAFLLFLCIGLMLFPLAQKKLRLFKERPLFGALPASKIAFSSPLWFEGSYSKKEEKYLNDNFGFRNWCVRFRNQFYYSLFNHILSGGMLHGKSGYIFSVDYLKAYSGMDYVGDSLVNARFNEMKAIQDTLARKGILFVLVLAPGQASYYSEFIPEPYHRSPVTNYLKNVEAAKARGINLLDFNAWFLQMKNTTKIPLFPKFSVHWSTYGACKAFDSISGYMEQKLHKNLARYDYSNVYWTDSLINNDDEAKQDVNLLEDLPQFKLAYPILKWGDTANSFRPRLLGVGDSYFERFYTINLLPAVYKLPRFWMYYDIVDNYKPDSREDVGDMDLKSYVERQNVVIVLFTETNFRHNQFFGWTFIDDLYNAYREGPAAYRQTMQMRKRNYELSKLKHNIRNSIEWFSTVKEEAEQYNISVDSEVALNARFQFRQDEKIRYQSAFDKTQDIAEEIRSDSGWYNSIKRQAMQRHLNLDSFIVKNAEFVFDARYLNNADSARQREISRTMKFIYNDTAWLNKIEIQSADLDIGLDSCVKLNAIYVIDHKNKK